MTAEAHKKKRDNREDGAASHTLSRVQRGCCLRPTKRERTTNHTRLNASRL